ncbi:tetraspanin-18-like [Spea bombifrons]|uniref:tetraspanin-18-like n=1 Tax=Spea bombifrons TaxID=233779 RepID=UPI002349CB45|nr:tetraspanin-18-like [Spea bombifrons]
MGILMLMKYMMFLFNGLIFLGGICLLGIGIWIVADPDGFQSIFTSNPLLYAGGYILLFVGLALSLVGFLGCFGAIRENRSLLLLFFMLILLFFTVELVGVILALTYQKLIKEEHFLVELQKFYKGDNSTEVFSQSWNTIMIALSCCGISGLSDFDNRSHFHYIYPLTPWPDACCSRDDPVLSGIILDREQCMQNKPGFINNQGCFITISRSLKKYISVAVYVVLGVLGIEGSYDQVIRLTNEVCLELRWWLYHMEAWNGQAIFGHAPDFYLESDSSLLGWGAACKDSATGGLWTKEEKSFHIKS